jgi:hypothetical protein
MRWRGKKELQDGAERLRKRFAWFPVEVSTQSSKNDRYWVWLERYYQYQKYSVSYDVIAGVSVMRWITIDNVIWENL